MPKEMLGFQKHHTRKPKFLYSKIMLKNCFIRGKFADIWTSRFYINTLFFVVSALNTTIAYYHHTIKKMFAMGLFESRLYL